MLYQAYQLQTDLLSPFRLFAQWLSSALWLEQTEGTPVRRMAAGSEVISRLRLTHTRPPYGIADAQVGGIVRRTEQMIPSAVGLLQSRRPHPHREGEITDAAR